MILQSLVRQYEKLSAKGKISRPGWTKANISYVLNIDEAGNLIAVKPLKDETVRKTKKGEKKESKPQQMAVPAGEKRTVNIAAQFLWDKAEYILGLTAETDETKRKRAKDCFAAMKDYHEKLLAKADGRAAKAVLAYFRAWSPDGGANHPALQKYRLDDLLTGNFVFDIGDDLSYAHEDKELCEIWDKRGQDTDGEKPQGQCLVTGQNAPIAILHPAIKGVRGAQSSGATLVGFNCRAFESYGHAEEQGLNAPVSEYAAFAYTTMLNEFLKSDKHHRTIGDTTFVYWEEEAEDTYCDIFSTTLFGDESDTVKQADLSAAFDALADNRTVDVDGIPLNPANEFYILGLSPNAARLSVRLFWRGSFGSLSANLRKHYDDLEIIKPSFVQTGKLPLWMLLLETANKNSRDKPVPALLTGAVVRAVISGGRYPAFLFSSIMRRVKAEQDNPDKKISKINWIKAAVIKACINRNHRDKSKEELKVSLNEESTNIAYVLGRLFAVLEDLQESANPGIKATIKDRYFNSACATPATVFPILLKLANSHLRKLSADKQGYAVSFEKRIGALMEKVNMAGDPIPDRLSLKEQGVFVVGYYHQVQRFFQKKEEQ